MTEGPDHNAYYHEVCVWYGEGNGDCFRTAEAMKPSLRPTLILVVFYTFVPNLTSCFLVGLVFSEGLSTNLLENAATGRSFQQSGIQKD